MELDDSKRSIDKIESDIYELVSINASDTSKELKEYLEELMLYHNKQSNETIGIILKLVVYTKGSNDIINNIIFEADIEETMKDVYLTAISIAILHTCDIHTTVKFLLDKPVNDFIMSILRNHLLSFTLEKRSY